MGERSRPAERAPARVQPLPLAVLRSRVGALCTSSASGPLWPPPGPGCTGRPEPDSHGEESQTGPWPGCCGLMGGMCGGGPLGAFKVWGSGLEPDLARPKAVLNS